MFRRLRLQSGFALPSLQTAEHFLIMIDGHSHLDRRPALKWLLWHGHARHAVDVAQELAEDAWGRAEDAKEEGTETAVAMGKLGRLHTAAEELATYLRRNTGQIVNYGERHRAGERISTGFVESAVNQIVSKRFSKKQSMRWTQAGAHLALQARTRVLNGELEDTFRRRWPGFQPPPVTPQGAHGL